MAGKEAVVIEEVSAFHALGQEDADDLVLRAELLRRISNVIEERGLTRSAAGQLMGMDQSGVAALGAARITEFSTDRLLRALNDLGLDVEVRITPATTGKGRVHVAA